MCRLAAREVSALKPVLDANNVKLIGVGLDDAGTEKFLAGKYFNGGDSKAVTGLQLRA